MPKNLTFDASQYHLESTVSRLPSLLHLLASREEKTHAVSEFPTGIENMGGCAPPSIMGDLKCCQKIPVKEFI